MAACTKRCDDKLQLDLQTVWEKRESAESCCVGGCVEAPKGSSGPPKGFRWEHFLMGENGYVRIFKGHN